MTRQPSEPSAPRGWIFRTLAAGALGTGLDFATLFVLVSRFHLHPVLASISGITLGAIANYALNRRFAFRSADTRVVREAIRFGLGTVTLFAVHTAVMWAGTVWWKVNFLGAKVAADLVVFAAGSVLCNRFVVFRACFAGGEEREAEIADEGSSAPPPRRYPTEEMAAFTVSPAVNRIGNDGHELIRPDESRARERVVALPPAGLSSSVLPPPEAARPQGRSTTANPCPCPS